MGIRLIGGIAASLLVTLAACAPQGQAQDAEAETPATASINAEASGIQNATIRGVDLALANDGMTCDVTFGDAFVSLDLPPPCRFLGTNETGEAVVEDYEESGAIALIGGPLVALSDYERFTGREPNELCSYIAQPVIVKDGEVTIGDMVASSQGFCGFEPPDEKFYYGLVHPPR